MAETKLRKYTVQEKLNKMEVDLIDIWPTVSTSAYTSGDLMFNSTGITNAVAVQGGKAILQSVAVSNDDALVGSFDLVFIASGDPPGDLNDPIAGESGLSDGNAGKVLGVVSINNMIDVGGASIGSKSNIGLVLKAEDTTTTIYVFGIARSTDNPTADDGYKLRIGVVKD